MKIYFTASTTADGEYLKQYQNVVFAIKKLGQTLISGEQIVSPQLLKEDKKISPAEIFSREKKAIEKADCVIAEVTSPSTGVGGEIAYALSLGKQVLALSYKEAKDLLSPMVSGNPSDNLYLEHYDDDNLKLVLKHFFEHVVNYQNRRGKLVIIDGGDGSGKATQAQLLVDYLKQKSVKVKCYDFPRYYTSFHGKTVGRFLAGEFGQLDEVSPYLASLAYALDRASAKEEMDQWLGQGGIIISNRYATSSMAHQGARLPKKKRKEFLDWIDELEYKVHKIPREDLVIYLYVPWRVGLELTQKKGERGYVKGLDIAEKDLKHRQAAEAMYLDLARKRQNWVKIDCVKNGLMRTKEEIQQEIIKVLKEKKII